MDDHLYPHTTLLSHIHMYVKIFCTKSLPAWHTKVEGIWSGSSTSCTNSKVLVDFYWNKQRSFSTFSDASANLSPPPLLVLQSVLLKIFNNSVEQLQINLTCAKPVKCIIFHGEIDLDQIIFTCTAILAQLDGHPQLIGARLVDRLSSKSSQDIRTRSKVKFPLKRSCHCPTSSDRRKQLLKPTWPLSGWQVVKASKRRW